MNDVTQNAFNLSRSFLDGVQFCVKENNLRLALCLLHNSVKQACIALIYDNGNRPICAHSIRGLLKVVNEFAPKLSVIFLDSEPKVEFILMVLEKGTANHRNELYSSLTKDMVLAIYDKTETFVDRAYKAGLQ